MSSMWPVHPDSQPWFRIGRFDVSTSTLFAGTLVVSWFFWVLFAVQGYTTAMALVPSALADGELWRVVSWPWAEGLSGSIWSILTVVMLWYFGNMLEGQIGRKRMIWLLVGIWAALTLTYTGVSAVFGDAQSLAGAGTIQLLIVLLWIAEYPHAVFLFNIPAWVFGLVIVGLQVFTLLAWQQWVALIALLISLVLVAILGRRVGLLTDYAWIPGQQRTPRRPRSTRASRAQARQNGRVQSDRERLDTLLDQINDQGIGSLTDAQRKEMLRLRDRLRKG